MKQPLSGTGHHGYDIELTGEQRQEIIKKKGYKDTPDYNADPRIRNFLQKIVDQMLPIMLGEKK